MAGIWTYLREGETLEVRHVDHEGMAELIVEGLGETSRHEFTSLDAVLLYLTTLESNLAAQGWKFLDFRPDRRQTQDRRHANRLDADRRRVAPAQHLPAKSPGPE